MACVSRSGYYNWLNTADTRQAREEKDLEAYALVKAAFEFRGYKKGARSIHMRLLHIGVIMNLKKIRRIMKKFSLICPIRKPNPYRQMAAAMKTSTVAPNLVKRQFKERPPRTCLLTDITYLHYHGHSEVSYLSTIIDVTTHEILAYRLSGNLKVDFVLETVDLLMTQHGYELDDTVIVHSDQGCHYTSAAFIAKLKDENFLQSMSRKGNCWDNAPQESFFGHMKDDIRRIVEGLNTYSEVNDLVDDWLDYYNNDRYQWDLEKLSPCEYYRYLTTGVYPLPIAQRK